MQKDVKSLSLEASEVLSSLTLFKTCNSVNACFLVCPLWLLVMDNKLVYYVYENLKWSSPSLPSLALSCDGLEYASCC